MAPETNLEQPRNDAPVPATLDLWSLGHSASQVAKMLGLPSHKHVARIIEHARSIRDPRAVLHAAKNGRLIGRPGRMATPPSAEIVPSTRALACERGHPQTANNTYASGRCRECTRLRDRARRA
jgi:hypothetical protein